MSSELEVLKQRIIELEAENAEIPDLRRKISEFDAERAEFKRMFAETLRMTEEERTRRYAENAQLRATIEELRKNNTKENTELRDRVTKVEEKQTLNDNTPNNNSSNFALAPSANLGVDHHEKSPQEKEMDNFLDEADKKSVGEDIRRHNKEKKLKKAEQASLNQDQESGTSDPEGIIPEVSNPVTEILPCQNSHRKKGAENIVQMIADGIKDDVQSSDKVIPCDVISAGGPSQNSSTDPLLSLAQLFDKADDAEYGAIRANQEEILRWYYYGKEFLTQVGVIVQDGKGKIGEKKAKGISMIKCWNTYPCYESNDLKRQDCASQKSPVKTYKGKLRKL